MLGKADRDRRCENQPLFLIRIKVFATELRDIFRGSWRRA